MARYRASIQSPADPEAVFAYLSRFDRAAEWDPGVSVGEMLTPAPVAVGSRFRLDAAFLGRTLPLEYEVVEFDPPRRIVLRAETALIVSTDSIVFETAAPGTGTGTNVVYDAVLEPKGALIVASPLLALAFRRIGERAGAGLRERLQDTVLR